MRLMKDSGIEWMGEIPNDWDTLKNKHIFYEIEDRNNGRWDGNDLLSVSEYYGVALKVDKIDEGDFITRAKSLDNYKVCSKGDLVINIMLAWKKGLGVSEHAGLVSPSYCVYRCRRKDIVPKYYHYLFRTNACADEFKRHSTGIIDSRLRLYSDKFFALSSPVPPYDVQNRIVNRLDIISNEISSYIVNQKSIIEKLKEYKQSIITEAVTKGLDPDVSMKDSSIEWIGEIPEHWKLVPLKHSVNIINEKCLPDGHKYIGLESIKSGEGTYYDSDVKVDGQSNMFKKFDILFGKLRPYLAKCIIAPFDGACSSELMVLRNYDGDLRFLHKTMLSNWFIEIVSSSTYGTKMPRASWSFIRELKIPCPTKAEQEQIANYLEKQSSIIDDSIEKKEKLIEQLLSYKNSIVYEAVTGKIEV